MQISEIVLNNYRAFYNEQGQETGKYKIDFSGKKNLLVYGENGSGKSSLFKGVKDLFRSSVKPDLNLVENIFSKDKELDIQPFVEIGFNDDVGLNKYRFSSDPAETNTGQVFLKAVARTRNFMTYRDLLRIHFVADPKVNLFEFLFVGEDALLGELTNPAHTQQETNIKMRDLWQVVSSQPDDINIADFCNGVNQILSDLRTPLNSLLKYFDNSLEIEFEKLTKEVIKEGKSKLSLKVKYYGVELDDDTEQYHHFLNEARLSALAICIFLSAHLSVPKPDYEILFLDDIFTGLDTSNRMPLLDILTAEVIEGTASDSFKDHQVLLTTYDRQWYELARNHLGESNWNYQEIFIDRHSEGFDQPILFPGEDDYVRASYYFKMKQYPACGNHQRKICEGIIKKFLPDHKKYVPNPNGSIEPIDRLATLINQLLNYLSENGIDSAPFSKLPEVLRVVMNPFSHDDLESPSYRREIELVFTLIDKLKKLKNTVLIKQGEKLITTQKDKNTGVSYQYEFEVQTTIRLLETESDKKLSKILVRPIKMIKMDDHSEKKLGYESESLEKALESVAKRLKITENLDVLDEFVWNNGDEFQKLKAVITS